MYWTWYTIALWALGIVFIVWGVWGLLDAADGGWFIVLIGVLFIGATFLITNVHTANIHDREAKAELRSKGFAVAEADTRSHEAVILFGACTRSFRLEKREGDWQLLAEQPNGEWRLFPPSLKRDAGPACSVIIG